MPTYKRPGTYVEEVLVSQNSGFGTNTSTVAAFVGHNPRGPVTPTLVTSWTDYVNRFGAFQGTSQLPFTMYTFFANQGRQAYVTRVPGDSATTASRTLKDRSPAVPVAARVLGSTTASNLTAGGSLVLKIDAFTDTTVTLASADDPNAVVAKIVAALTTKGTASLIAGVLTVTSSTTGVSSRVEVRATSTPSVLTDLKLLSAQVDTGEAASATDTIQINAQNPGAWANALYVDVLDTGSSTSGRFTLLVKLGGVTASNIVERWTDLSMTVGDRRYAPSLINSLTGGSAYISVVDKGSPASAGDKNPLVQLGTALVGGADGTNDQHDISDTVTLLDNVQQPVVLNCPGLLDPTEINTVLAYAEARGDVFVVVDTAPSLTGADALAFTVQITPSSYGAVYYPHLVITDPSTPTAGVTKVVPPGGAVVGQYHRNDANRGVFKAPAGITARLLGVLGLERKLTNAELDALNSAPVPVNAIRNLVGNGVCIMGARTLKTGYADRYVPVRRTLIFLKQTLQDLTAFAVFEPNDARLWESIRTVLTQYLTTFWQQGGLQGGTPTAAFYVTCDGALNTTQTQEAGEVHIEVGVSLEYPAEYVVISIGQSNGGASVVDNA